MALGAIVPALIFAAFSAPPAAATTNSNPFCTRLGHNIQASSGAQMYCFGPQTNGSLARALRPYAPAKGGPINVNAASLAEDISPSGVRAYGQSETSIASSGTYVVEAWNDATVFFSPCPSAMDKESMTGAGFSNNNGASFTDLGGLPNAGCGNARISGDPSVEAYTIGGKTYFYITSLFPSTNPSFANGLSLTACQVSGTGSAATLNCGQPIVAATSSECSFFCSFLDKDFLAIDASRHRLYLSYTEFGPNFGSPSANGVIELAVCDLSTPTNPVCLNGSGSPVASHARLAGGGGGGGAPVPPYLVIAPGDPNGCENEGAYPAVDKVTGDVYVAYEFNWATNIFGCFNPVTGALTFPSTQVVLTHTPFRCLTLPAASCSGPDSRTTTNIVSMAAAFIPGYNRFPMNDFPRIAVSNLTRTVSVAWNDAANDPLGDIVFRSYNLGRALIPVQSAPVRVNATTGGTNFLPALRNAAGGSLVISWYSRATANTALTDVSLAMVSATASSPPIVNTTVTSVSTDWTAVSSDIVPNFGDYTDNYVNGGIHVAWSDGRLGLPQPFTAKM